MKFSVNWLREFVDLPKNPEDIAELLTRAGIETKNIETRGAHIDKVIDAAEVPLRPVEKKDAPWWCGFWEDWRSR